VVRSGDGSPVGRGSEVLIVFLSCAAQFMVVLDVSVVNVALPTIQTALGFDALDVQWVVNGYALTFAGFLLLGGRLADLYGLRRIFLAGLALFAGASLVGGLTGTAALLVAARAVQGLGAAVLAPATLTLLTATFPEGPRRTRAIASWTAVGLAGGAAGNLLSGAITEFLSWRWILLINVPLGAAAIVVAVRRLHRDPRTAGAPRLDLPGAITAVVGLTTLTYGIVESRERGWAAPSSLATLATGVATLAVFAVVEARFSRSPLFPLQLLRVPAVSTGNLVMILAGACFMPMWYFLAFLMQDGLHFTPLQTGLGFLPHTLITMMVGARVAPMVMQQLAARAVIALGAVIAAAGFGWQALTATTLDGGYLQVVLGPAILMSVGGGLLNTPITTTVMSGVSAADAGAASGLMNTTKQIGGALGLAALIVVAAPASDGNLNYMPVFASMAAILIVAAIIAFGLPYRHDRARSEA